ncbi:MAG: hypothetical protein AAGG38_06280 [Planctomycetota bacterium]
MPLTNEQVTESFKIIGKLIFLSEIPGPQITAFRKAAMGLVDQIVTGDADEFDYHSKIAIPMTTAVSTVNASLGEVPGSARGSIESYLSKFVAPLLGMASGTLATTVIDELIGSGLGIHTVLLNGEFDSYFNSTWGKQLPTAEAGNETIDDSWVTSDVV